MATCPDCGEKYADDIRVCDADGATLLPDAAVAQLDDDLSPGTEVGDYKIDAKIGSGAFGAVYSATHMLIGKRAAMKVLASRHSTNRTIVSRFLSEARAVNQIGHKHIVDIFSFGSLDDGRQYFVMELLEGTTLTAHMEERGPLEPTEALTILRRVARALDAAHSAGIAHRDLKPDNVFLVFDEDGVFPKLLDFGIAKLLGDEMGNVHDTGTGTPMGTPLYMSPEQWRGKNVDHRADIFSLGVMTFELLAGSRPFSGESQADLMVKVATEDPPLLSDVRDNIRPSTDEAIIHMLAREPDDRPESASAAIRALQDSFALGSSTNPTHLDTSGVGFTADGSVPTAAPTHRPRVVAMAVGLAAVGVGAIALMMAGNDATTDVPRAAQAGSVSTAASSGTAASFGTAASSGTAGPQPAGTTSADAAAPKTAPATSASTTPSSASASAATAPVKPAPRTWAPPKPRPKTPAAPTKRPLIPVTER